MAPIVQPDLLVDFMGRIHVGNRMSKTLYLDSRDLINVIRFGDPVTADELRRTLQDRDTTLVYSFSNVLE